MKSRILELFDITCVCFNPYLTDKRNPIRPINQRQASFNDDYDFGCIFVDIFFDEKKSIVHAIGAPLYQQKDLVFNNNIKLVKNLSNINIRIFNKNLNFSKVQIEEILLDRTTHYKLYYQSLLKLNYLKFNNYGKVEFYNINNSENELLRNKRVIIIKNKDNKFEWFRDFAHFYKTIHKADALLIYDSSENYTSRELLNFLKENIDLSVVVVRWPIPFGPTSYNKSKWDSDYSLYTMFEHAKFRFLKHVKSVLHVDIDELVISKNNVSIFEEAEKYDKPIYFDGMWVVNTINYDNYSYKDLIYIDKETSGNSDMVSACKKRSRAVVKWCVCPKNIEDFDNIQCRVHDHYNIKEKISLRKELNSNFETRHFMSITTGWRTKARFEVIEDKTNLEECEILKKYYIKLGWFN